MQTILSINIFIIKVMYRKKTRLNRFGSTDFPMRHLGAISRLVSKP